MSYAVTLDQFEGPLDLLLQLVESEKLTITEISLVKVTEPFVTYIRQNQGVIPPEELADFLVIAAKLLYLKSKMMLPDLHDPELEEGPDLASQLKLYKAFSEASLVLSQRWNESKTLFGRQFRAKKPAPAFLPPQQVDGDLLREYYLKALKRLEPVVKLPKAAIERVVTIEEKIATLKTRIHSMMRMSFQRFLADSHDRYEMVVSFLALLELIKQKEVTYEQSELFSEITLKAPTV
ncbi:MAG: segregation/condensation protein A [Candidatus Magasanikbacteria bacterium]|nr:segregation/condensation protein A [Candidatus Magasanikbacteria bacterium]MCA9389339.1 segregation/condensation protein A [Candidatus Magasanikbacteria bacterium]MCA9390914.1 segregation/condensation protein A [Candidatus Magasanikbacteria bacterium]USN52897.1 MAG: segregation/condensation protein A [Candidatus Nomurabacteria bacterium]HPF95290.1 segregation/condensation protein A [bacterium]